MIFSTLSFINKTTNSSFPLCPPETESVDIHQFSKIVATKERIVLKPEVVMVRRLSAWGRYTRVRPLHGKSSSAMRLRVHNVVCFFYCEPIHVYKLMCWCVKGKLGELQISLCYQPTAECITVVILQARELKAKDINGLSGLYYAHTCN